MKYISYIFDHYAGLLGGLIGYVYAQHGVPWPLRVYNALLFTAAWLVGSVLYYFWRNHVRWEKVIISGCEARGDADSAYMTRITFLEWAHVKVRFHYFHRSDADDLHDHPWNFLTIPLWHGYREQVLEKDAIDSVFDRVKTRRLWPLIPYFRRAEHCHRVVLDEEFSDYEKQAFGMPDQVIPALTLCICFRSRREWGFWQKGQWLYWWDYFTSNGC